jgi:hypothetical protein
MKPQLTENLVAVVCKNCRNAARAEKFLRSSKGSHLLWCRFKPGYKSIILPDGKVKYHGTRYGTTEPTMTCDKWEGK